MSKRLIRFDWAVKKLLRNKANFVVLEGFLSELLFEDIKIQKILESEGNQETEQDKYNRVDILVQNAKNELVIVEIQNTYEIDYFHRMAYGASKALTENLSLGQSYSEIKKVISVNIVYFDLGQGKDYVYKGTTNFQGLHERDLLQLSNKQKETFTKQNISDIFPEYYIIKVNQFNDVAKDTLDEWVYFLKNSEVKDSFKAKGLAEAKEVLDVMRLNQEQTYGYNRYLDYLHVKASEALSLKIQQEELMEKKIAEAKEEIRKDEKLKNTIEFAKNLIKLGLDNNLIEKSTGLTIEQIEALRNEK
ncbi:Rpn family recombination-promoting nuclease/putative transposase [Hugenholtzia roseola]|uniref:Rpn family recombination-promoting nuclease/putative transposase n=1 Tax=Hugenholtzia roseola TaxID=1002 RepID=UPI00040901D8|nr:Rpn family recombination-promoting nuclease/putative transposase [Hugenholtzia roseola]